MCVSLLVLVQRHHEAFAGFEHRKGPCEGEVKRGCVRVRVGASAPRVRRCPGASCNPDEGY